MTAVRRNLKIDRSPFRCIVLLDDSEDGSLKLRLDSLTTPSSETHRAQNFLA
jgi:hypothetical protein